jgi:hypothetical protein
MILVLSYLGLTGNIKGDHIQAMLYDGNGQVTSKNTHLLRGDEWMVQGDIIKFLIRQSADRVPCQIKADMAGGLL